MYKQFTLLLAAAAMLGISQDAHSAGFALIEQSVSGMGTAYAGGAAIAEDASHMWFNPAGMMRLCGLQTASGEHIVVPVADYDDHDSLSFITNAPLTGNDGRDAGEAAMVGHFAVVKRWNNCLAFGLTINSPFGLVTDYKDSWKGRYHAIRSQLLTININPAIAYRFNKCWSIGAGFDVMYLHAKLSNAVDFGLIAFAATSGGAGTPQGQDGRVKLKGNSWGYGGNIGILWEPSCDTRFGAHYRSEVKHDIKGSEKFEDIPAVITGIPALNAAFQDTRVKSKVHLPMSASISGYHRLNSCWGCWEFVGDVTWTKWDVLKELRFRFNNENQADGVTTLRWKNAFRYSLGAIFRPWSCWAFRLGAAYDKTPVRDKELRTPRIPDESRVWTTFGIGFQWNHCLHFDFGYAHLFVPTDPKIDKSDSTLAEDLFRGGLHGKWDAYTDIISFGTRWNF